MSHKLFKSWYKDCLVDMNHKILYFRTIHEYMKWLTEIFKKLQKSSIKLQPGKCEFLPKEVAYIVIGEYDPISPIPNALKIFQKQKTYKKSDFLV